MKLSLTKSDILVSTADTADNVDVADAVGNKSDTTAGNSLVALLKQVISTKSQIVSRTAANLPATTQTAYFTVTGRVLITNIVGEVTTVIQAQTCNIDLWSNPTVGTDVALCAVADINADAVGTLYTITGTLADAIVPTTSGAVKAQANAILVTAGTIDLKTSATNTGATKWTLHYIPLDAGSTVVTA